MPESDPVVALEDLVEYRDSSIVSRALVKKGGGSVTIFAFDRGQELSEHTAPFDALVHVLDGAAEISVFGHPHTLSRGQALLMPAKAPHAVRATERFKMVLTLIKS